MCTIQARCLEVTNYRVCLSLTMMISSMGATNAQITPFSVDNQQLYIAELENALCAVSHSDFSLIVTYM